MPWVTQLWTEQKNLVNFENEVKLLIWPINIDLESVFLFEKFYHIVCQTKCRIFFQKLFFQWPVSSVLIASGWSCWNILVILDWQCWLAMAAVPAACPGLAGMYGCADLELSYYYLTPWHLLPCADFHTVDHHPTLVDYCTVQR